MLKYVEHFRNIHVSVLFILQENNIVVLHGKQALVLPKPMREAR